MGELKPAGSAIVDRAQVRRSFARVAEDYPRHDFFAREIDRRMQERLDVVRLAPATILDLGCSRGASLAGLRQRYAKAQTMGVDLVPEMLRAAATDAGWRGHLPAVLRNDPRYFAADAAALPLRANSVGLVWSNLLLHWLEHPLPALCEAQRVLEVGGLLMFSTLGPDTLQELRSAFADDHAHTQRFTDLHDLGDMLVEAGFADPVMDMEVLTLTYDSFPALLAELRASGGRCAMQGRQRTLAGRGRLQAVEAAYAAQAKDGKLPATFEVIYGHAWKAAPKQTADGRSIVRFMDRPR